MLISVQTPAAGGTAYAQFDAQWCQNGNGYLLNDTGTSLDVKIGAAASPITVANGKGIPFKLVFSCDELFVRRTDQATAQVTVEAQVGITVVPSDGGGGGSETEAQSFAAVAGTNPFTAGLTPTSLQSKAINTTSSEAWEAVATAGATTSWVWVGPNDATVLLVGPNRRFTTIAAAVSYATALNAAVVIDLDPSVAYTTAGGTWPAIPISVRGNGAVVTTTTAVTVTASYRAYDLNVIGNVVYAGGATDRYFITGGTRVGNVTLTTGLLHDDGSSLLSGVVTVNGGTFECISTTITSQISHTAGQLLIQNCNINATKSTAMVTSTATAATSALAIVNSFVTNLGTGTALDISANTQAIPGANAVANVTFTTASAASVVAGTAKLQVLNCNYTVTPTGSGFSGSNWTFCGATTPAELALLSGKAQKNFVTDVDRRMWTTAGLSANMFFHGSSTTAGGTDAALNVSALPLDGYVNYAARHMGATPLVGWNKYGTAGGDISDFITSAPFKVDQYVVSGRTNILYVQGAKNFLQSGGTPASWIANFKAYCTARKQAGWNKIYVIIPSFPIYAYQTMNASMPAFVAACLSDSTLWDSTYSDGIIRWDAVAYLHDSSKTTQEGLHPNLGYIAAAGPSLATQTYGLLLDPTPITVTITSPSSGGTITTDATVAFTTSASAATGYVARLYAGLETTISGGLNESLSLISTVSNATSLSLPISKLPIGTTNLYVAVEETSGRIGTSAKLPVTLSFSPVVQTGPTDVSIASGGMATFTAVVAASPTVTLAWQVSTDGGSTWNSVSNDATYAGVATQELTVMAVAGITGYKYRLHVSNGIGSADTSPATLTVSGTVTTRFQDTFPTTGSWTSGTRTPTIGNTWTLTSGGWNFDSGTYATPTGTGTVSSFDVGAASYRYRCILQWTASTNTDMALFAPHFVDSQNRYKAFFNGGVIVRLDSQIGSNYPKTLDQATTAFSLNTDYTVDLVVSGVSLVVFINRVRYCTAPIGPYGDKTLFAIIGAGLGWKYKDPTITSA